MSRLKLTFLSFASLALALLTVSPAYAVDPLGPVCQGRAASSAVCNTNGDPSGNPVVHIIDVTITIFSIVAGVAAIIMIILGAFFLVTSSGNPEGVAKARARIIAALIGLVVISLSYTLVHFVVVRLLQ